MQIDDRLATVLAMQAASERAAQTQFRQLLDLAGSARETDEGMLEAAYERLSALSAALPAEARAAIVREPGVRIRNPGFVAYLASQELPVAAAAAASARLTECQWEALIPALSVEVRALLGRRNDLPEATKALLGRLGVSGLGLPKAPTVIEQAPAPTPPAPEQEDDVLELDPELEISQENHGIGTLVRRIEAFRRAREHALPIPANTDAPRLPLGEHHEDAHREIAAFDFATDPDGRIAWAEPAVAPMVNTILLADAQADAPARADSSTIAAIRRRQPVRGGRIALDGAPAIAGEWRIDAAPVFAAPGGRFTGYRGRMRRPVVLPEPVPEPADSPAERMRQVLHELRTPVNAIQGFAEIIQQQLFGYTPNEYRALAAAIAGDAARMLAGFEELERLARLESGALALEPGMSDLNAIVAGTARQLDTVLRPRSAGLELVSMSTMCPVALGRADAELLIWRLLATLAGSASPGEALQIVLAQNGTRAGIEIDLPISLADRPDIFESSPGTAPQAVSSGMFGAGFTLRLARAEARAAGGDLQRVDDLLVLSLPLANGMDTGGNIADTA